MLHCHDVATDHKWLRLIKVYQTSSYHQSQRVFQKFNPPDTISFPYTPWDWIIAKVTRNLLYMTFARQISCKPQNAGYLQYFYLLPTKTQRRPKQLRPRTSPKSMVRTERPKEFCMAKLEQASQTKRGGKGLFQLSEISRMHWLTCG